ncbi:hypothetical conserved protein [Candidatus Nitrosoglobus terrae]|uniref:Hypothetical conserved protein n=1 Tax=Candidatus Nitrosoglobus terrae TaxID=1630141 RepID=A0A1Q2SNV2_9GAMM|nr:hypothetical protein [Candidatus Nitrosoglobus terrae]BAW80814.1 hypothetical conserved protein [Candidatus Nitrosoglobus terrae]
MKHKNKLISIFLFIAAISTVAYAEPIIKDHSEITGAWLLEMTALKKDGTGSNKEVATWDFHPSGTVVISGYNKFLKHNTSLEKTYKVTEESVIEVKDDSETVKYLAVEKTGNKMILKGPFGYYFFKKK